MAVKQQRGMAVRLAGAAAAMCGLAACTDSTPTAPAAGGTPLSARSGSGVAAGQQAVRAAEERHFRWAERLPGFGGYAFDADGNLVVALTDTTGAEAARGAFAALLREQQGRSAVRGGGRVVVRRVEHTFADLARWRDLLLPELPAIPGVLLLDADEQANRVVVGVAIDRVTEVAAAVERIRASLGVPANAVIYVPTAPIEPAVGKSARGAARAGAGAAHAKVAGASRAATLSVAYRALNEYWPDVLAGTGITSSTGPCSIGPVGYRNSARVFLTASHCTGVMFDYDGAGFYQPTIDASQPAYYAGAEVADPRPVFTCAPPTGSPSGNYPCRPSDAAAVGLSSSRSWAVGNIARPIERGLDANYGSTYVDLANPYIPVAGEDVPWVDVGVRKDKVGAASGWTSGLVERACADVFWASGARVSVTRSYVVNCQTFVRGRANPGDSGGPVFDYNPTYGTALISGVVSNYYEFGRGFVYSPISSAEGDLGGMGAYW